MWHISEPYCVYNFEISNPGLASGSEATAPQCNTTTQGADRRLLYVAIIDCAANSVKGGGQTLPVQAFASVFVTEPAGGPPAPTSTAKCRTSARSSVRTR